jgi:hypothetical protein
MSILTTQKHKSLNFEFKTHEVQLEDQEPKKSSIRSSRRRKNRKASKYHEKRQTKRNDKEELKKLKTQDQNQNSP